MAARTKKRSTRKKTARKKTTRRPTSRASKKKTTKKKPAGARPGKITAAPEGRTKSEFYGTIAEHVGITKKEVSQVFEVMQQMIAADLSKRGPGEFKLPGMMKIVVQRKPAQPRRKGINPFTGEETWFKAKPARNVVKVRPLKGLKDLV